MGWLLNLLMLGKGKPPNGVNFTALSAMGTPGVPRSFDPKPFSAATPTLFYYLKHIAGLG